jgi:integrase
MPRRAKQARLWFRPEERKDGKIVRQGAWLILDRGRQVSTGCGSSQNEEAERALAQYIASKYQPGRRERDLADIKVADVISIYLDDVAANKASSFKISERCDRLLDFWGEKTLDEVRGLSSREYAKQRENSGGARRDLEDLRAAINHHAKEGLHRGTVRIVLPEKGAARDRWLTRSEAARLLWTCWRTREVQTWHGAAHKGRTIETKKRPLRHLARFILIGLYTGRRAGAIASASFYAASGRSFVDLDAGLFYRLAQGRRATQKRQPPVPLPDGLLSHMRRWKRRGEASEGARPQFVVEFNGQPVASVKTGFATAVRLAKLEGKVSPHTLRHTAATWLMQRGAPIWEAASYLGMSEQTLRRTYAHHSPDFMRNAARAVASKAASVKKKATG